MLKIILYYAFNSWTDPLRQMKFVRIKGHEYTCKFYLKRCFVYRLFKYGDGAKFWGYVQTNTEPLSVERSSGSSVSIVFGYGLDDLAIVVRSPVEAKWFFL
jgi:hypothetical protein